MRALGAEGIAEKSGVAAAKQLSTSDSTKNGAWKTPSSCSAATLRLSPRRRVRREAPPGHPAARTGLRAMSGRVRRSKGNIAP